VCNTPGTPGTSGTGGGGGAGNAGTPVTGLGGGGGPGTVILSYCYSSAYNSGSITPASSSGRGIGTVGQGNP
jgi:hypothetical protein